MTYYLTMSCLIHFYFILGEIALRSKEREEDVEKKMLAAGKFSVFFYITGAASMLLSRPLIELEENFFSLELASF